jgi:6-phosphogluconolactonase (cycloisomerase 2 family)
MVRANSPTRVPRPAALAVTKSIDQSSGKTTNHALPAHRIPFFSLSPIFKSFILIALFMVAISAHAQFPPSFVYVNNQSVQNQISAYAVSPGGSLTEIAGSPYLTGGSGGTTTCTGMDRIVTSYTQNLLYVANAGDQTISAFQINPSTGVLTAAPGSPFASGLSLDSCGGISLALTPDGNFLMAASAGSINTFSVASTGALAPLATTANCCSPTVSMKVSPNGLFLAVTSQTNVSTYSISGGLLTPVPGSPFPQTGTGKVSGVEFSCATDAVYAAETNSANLGTITDGWSMDATGALSVLGGTPFPGSGISSTVVTVSPSAPQLFTGDTGGDKINSFSIATNGSIIQSGFFGGPPNIHTPMGLAFNYDGSYLFVADDPFGVAVFKNDGSGVLGSTADVQLVNSGEVQGLAVYPPKTCAPVALTLTEAAPAGPVESGGTITYGYTLTNVGPVAVQGSIGWDMPVGTNQLSCTASVGGACTQLGSQNNATFASIPAGATVSASVTVQTSTDLADKATIVNHAVAYSNIGYPLGSTSTATVPISANSSSTTLTVAPASAIYGSIATLTATLTKDTVSGPINGRTITFSLNGVVIGTAVTNAAGVASRAAFTTGLGAGSTSPITASYAGETIGTIVYGASSGSNSLAITPATLTVTAANASKVYGAALPATFNSTITGFVNGETSAVVSGAAVCSTTATAASTVGSYPITCSTAGLSSANYVFVTVPGTLTVTPAPLQILVNDATRVYGAPDPPFSGTVTGLIGADTVTVTYSTNATATSGAGAYSIFGALVPDAISANYQAFDHSGVLTITGATLTVTGNNASRLYGDPNPAFSGTISGLLPGDVITATFTTIATPASAAGVFPITPVFNDPGNKLGNYILVVTPGILSVNQAPLTASANNAVKVYGLANPVFTGTVTGLKNGDVITESFTTTAVLTSPVGAYPIIPALVDPGGKAGNYITTFNNGTLTVVQAPLTVNITNVSRVYGNANPTFAGTIVGLRPGDNITATYSSVAVPASPVGTYPITPTFADPGAKLPNYTVTITGGILTVTPAPLTVTAGGGQRIYGSANPAGTVLGLKNADVITVTSTSPTINSPVGTYTVTPIPVDPGGVIGNYTVTLKTATLTITKAPLTVTANNATVVLNTAAPGFTATYAGFVAGDTVANLTGVLNCTAPLNTVGLKTITCGGQSSPNYTITFVNGTATVVFASAGACTAGPGHQILAPIATNGSTVFTKATTASIPVQFRVCDANGATVTSSVVSTFTLLSRITGGVPTVLNQNQTAAFTFNAAAQDDVATLSTSTPTNLTAGTTYLYQIKLIDNSTINFQFTMN